MVRDAPRDDASSGAHEPPQIATRGRRRSIPPVPCVVIAMLDRCNVILLMSVFCCHAARQVGVSFFAEAMLS